MKKKIITIFILSFVVLFTKNIFAKDAGTTSANFLKIGVGARATALGGAYTGVDNSIYSLYWNPSGITEIKNAEITGMHNNWIEDINYNFLGCVIPLQNFTLGFSATMISMDDIEKTIELAGGGYQKTGTFSPKDYAFNISAAKKINKKLNAGITLKYIKSNLGDASANAVALDAGFLYKPSVENLQIGFAIQNLGTKLKYINKKEDLPFNVVIGGKYNLLDNLILVTDINKYIDNDVKFHSGVEWNVNILSLRIGYNSLSDLDNGLTCGLGLNYKQLKIDYAFEPQGDLGDSHKFSMTVSFGK